MHNPERWREIMEKRHSVLRKKKLFPKWLEVLWLNSRVTFACSSRVWKFKWKPRVPKISLCLIFVCFLSYAVTFWALNLLPEGDSCTGKQCARITLLSQGAFYTISDGMQKSEVSFLTWPGESHWGVRDPHPWSSSSALDLGEPQGLRAEWEPSCCCFILFSPAFIVSK